MPGESEADGQPWLSPERRLTAILILLSTVSAFWVFAGPDVFADPSGIAALLALPMSLGGLVARYSFPDGEANFRSCLIHPVLAAFGLVGLGALILREGAICVVMLVVPWVLGAVGGAIVVQLLRRMRAGKSEAEHFKSSALVLIPLLVFAAEQAAPAEWEYRTVTRNIVVDAAPEAIWPLLVDIPAIGPEEGRATLTHDLLGVPRPTDATLERAGDDWVRRAQWGPDVAFEEWIDRREPGRSISWTFAFPDDSVQMHTDRHIDPAGPVLAIERGEYRLQPLADGRTRIVLSTRYRMRSHMAPYLGLWGEVLLGDVQSNVLSVIAGRAHAS